MRVEEKQAELRAKAKAPVASVREHSPSCGQRQLVAHLSSDPKMREADEMLDISLGLCDILSSFRYKMPAMKPQ